MSEANRPFDNTLQSLSPDMLCARDQDVLNRGVFFFMEHFPTTLPMLLGSDPADSARQLPILNLAEKPDQLSYHDIQHLIADVWLPGASQHAQAMWQSFLGECAGHPPAVRERALDYMLWGLYRVQELQKKIK